MQEALLHGLDELCLSNNDVQDSEEESQQWVTSVNQEGLVHVTTDAFMLFHSMEIASREQWKWRMALVNR